MTRVWRQVRSPPWQPLDGLRKVGGVNPLPVRRGTANVRRPKRRDLESKPDSVHQHSANHAGPPPAIRRDDGDAHDDSECDVEPFLTIPATHVVPRKQVYP